jgi:hypothetical protein
MQEEAPLSNTCAEATWHNFSFPASGCSGSSSVPGLPFNHVSDFLRILEPKLPNPNNAATYTEGIYCEGTNKEIEAVIPKFVS